MFEDALTALTPRSASVLERELRRLLQSAVPVTVGPAEVGYELAEGFRWHRAGLVTSADPPADEPARGDAPAAADDGVLAGALVLDAQFAAGTGFLAEARAAQAVIGREEARRARALAGFAASRPVALDRPDAEVGAAAAASRAARPAVLAGVSEWAVDEVAVALGITGAAASRLLAESLRLVWSLPRTLTALEDGRLTWRHAQVMTDLVAPLGEEVRAEAEARLLDRVTGKTPAQLRMAARRVVARLDAEAIERRVTAAVRDRRVSLYAGEGGMDTLATVLPRPVARAVEDALEQYADAAATPDDERTQAQRMADCLVDLVLRPGEHGLAPVQARLTVVAAVQTLLGGNEPGEVDGDLVPAAMVRDLAVALGPVPPNPDDGAASTTAGLADTAGLTHTAEGAHTSGGADTSDRAAARSTGTDVTAERCTAGAAGADPATGAQGSGTDPAGWRGLADLLGIQRSAGTALEHRPQIALVDELTGTLVALTDATGLRRAAGTGAGLGPPPASPGYRPGRELDRHVRHRDRRCRFPGCRARPVHCDLDHTTPYPWGCTSAENLCCLCRHHHRLSHQAPGWSLRGLPDGGLRWTTPTGQNLTTYPPGYGTDDDFPPEAGCSEAASRRPPGGQSPPGTAVHGRRPSFDAVPAGDDPPPF